MGRLLARATGLENITEFPSDAPRPGVVSACSTIRSIGTELHAESLRSRPISTLVPFTP